MYLYLFILLLIASLFCIIFHFRKKKIICKVKCMEKCAKCNLIDELVEPFGYCYHCSYGFFSSTLNAWQKKAGYTYLYDYMAPRFQMVLDALPIYFDYDGKTWMIEFWKGQYGIHTGAEIGIYHTDHILSTDEYKTTLFDCADKSEMLNCSFLLYNKNGDYVQVSGKHWWLTAFLTGCFSSPKDLCMKASLTFPDREMQSAFIKGMYRAGYTAQDLNLFGPTLTFTFCREQKNDFRPFTRFWCRFSQWENRLFCKLYLQITKPFCHTEDRILYLYYYLPFIFRRILRLHRFDKRCHRKKCCMRSKI